MVLNWVQKYQNNWNLLRVETDRIGAEVEQWPYEDLNRAAEDQPPIESRVGDISVSFQIDCYDTLPNGDLAICIDAHTRLPTLFGVKPSYQFFKRQDGSVYY